MNLNQTEEIKKLYSLLDTKKAQFGKISEKSMLAKMKNKT